MRLTARSWLLLACGGLLLTSAPRLSAAPAAEPRRPNVVLIMTDDQGWGDCSFHGNTHLKTPHLDRLAAEGVEFTRFHVSPVCSPTRSSLLTGRYNYRTGVVDTFLGRSTMAANETTLAEMLSAAGYRTAIFGKWHLGDDYPSRSIDQGFGESLVHRGGGIGQPADPPGNHYQDPILVHNGREEQAHGYCSDVFTDAAIGFIDAHRREPFFVYLAYNCPHSPLEVPEAYHRRYQGMGLDDDTAKLYGMVANIDDNLGRLFEALKAKGLDRDTIVVFLTDNGPAGRRYNGELHGQKGTVYDGGIRVPCLVRWTDKWKAGRKIDVPAAHIDVVPTLLEACGVNPPSDVEFDGRSLAPLLDSQDEKDVAWPPRLLFFQWHRGDVPEKFRACAARGPRYKLVHPEARGGKARSSAWELYDMLADPGETKNLIDSEPRTAADMKAAYAEWFDDVSRTRGYPVPHIIVGTEHENPVTLTRQDWRGPQAGWTETSVGHWEIDPAAADAYRITVRGQRQPIERSVRLRVGTRELAAKLAAGSDQAVFDDVRLEPGVMRIEALIEGAGRKAGAQYIDVERPALAKAP